MDNMQGRLAILFLFLLAGFCLQSCEELIDEDMDLDNQDFYKLLILPKNPTSEDLILLIENTCGIEPEPVITYSGNRISYKRYFNSLMGAPCIPTIDTTTIGPLEAGNYELLHWVIDKNHLLKDSIISVDTLDLIVK
jgi:hypothetical protein